MRMAAVSIIVGFRTIALPIAEAEASIETLTDRWQKQLRRFWVNLHTLPRSHPFWKTRKALEHGGQRFKSPLQRTAEATNGVDLSDLERIEPFYIPS